MDSFNTTKGVLFGCLCIYGSMVPFVMGSIYVPLCFISPRLFRKLMDDTGNQVFVFIVVSTLEMVNKMRNTQYKRSVCYSIVFVSRILNIKLNFVLLHPILSSVLCSISKMFTIFQNMLPVFNFWWLY